MNSYAAAQASSVRCSGRKSAFTRPYFFGSLSQGAWWWLAKYGDRDDPPVHGYFASNDRFASGQRQMAQALAAGRVHEVEGGHDWAAWRALWMEFLCSNKSALQ